MKKINKKSAVLVILSILIISKISHAQIVNCGPTISPWCTQGNGGTFPATDFVGTTDNNPLQFGTNGTINWMTLTTGGQFGIGLTPGWQLDVNSEINISTPVNYYMIGGFTVLHNTGTQNIAVGQAAGSSLFTLSALDADNTYMGYYAGNSSSSVAGTIHNTFIGSEAGRLNTSGSANTFIGRRSGYSNSAGDGNSFLGMMAGRNATGSYCTFIGYWAGKDATGDNNVCLGSSSGASNLVGGIGNTLLGNSSNVSVANPNYATAIGYQANVTTTNTMILGNNNVNVGIGLSGVTGGPLRKLHIQDGADAQLRLSSIYNSTLTDGTWTDFQTNLTTLIASGTQVGSLYIHPSSDIVSAGTPVDGNVGINTPTPQNTLEIETNYTPTSPVSGSSGLRFHDLTTASLPIANPFGVGTPCVLSVNTNGDVVLVRDVGGGSLSSTCGSQNFLPKTDASLSNVICSQVYDDGTTVSIRSASYGAYLPGTLFYKFEVTGTSVFSLVPNPNGAGYTLNNTQDYPLMVKTNLDNYNNLSGLAILSSASNPTPQDALHIYADNNNLVHFVNIGNNTVFEDKTISNSLLGFIPNEHVTVVKEDFAINQTQGPQQATFYTEAQWNNGNSLGSLVKTNAIFGNNNWDDTQGSGSYSGFEFTGVRGESSRTMTDPNINNIGGFFHAKQATGVNEGVHLTATGSTQGNVNYGALIWVAPTDNETDETALGTVRSNFGVYSRVIYNNGAAVNQSGWFLAQNGFKNYGVNCTALNPNGYPTQENYGGHFEAREAAKYNFAVEGFASSHNPLADNRGGNFVAFGAGNNYGVRAEAPFGGANCYGGYFNAVGGAALNYGVYATSASVCVNGPPAGCPMAAGFFNGAVYAAIAYFASDSILKDNITPLPEIDTLANALTAYSFTYDTTSYPSMNLPLGTHYGFLAEEVEAKFPSMVKEFIQPAQYDTVGIMTHQQVNFKAVNYVEFIPLLWSGFQNMQQQMDSMKQVMAACCNISPRITNPNNNNNNTGSIELENLKSIQLEQNDPNPFVENSIIRWSIPTDFKEATILFFENSGSQINKYKIEQKGNGELQVFGSKLSSGIYTYTLVVDGKIIDSKKMMKAK